MKKSFDQVFPLVKEGSDLAIKKGKVDICRACLKGTEELGELAAEVLKYVGHKKSSQTKTQSIKKIKSEGVDTIIAILDVLNLVDISPEEIFSLTEKAVKKWKLKHINKNEREKN